MDLGVPGGLGPWFVSLLFNTSEGPKKQTHLCAHTYPHHAPLATAPDVLPGMRPST